MRPLFGIVALVAVAAASSAPVAMADDQPTPQQVMVKKAAEEVVATPIQEFMKDLYEAVVRKGGSRFFRRLRYLTAGMGSTRTVLSLSDFALEKLKTKVFKNSINETMWRKLRTELYFALLDWWVATPEDPMEAAELGLWHSMVQLQKDVLGPALRGSPRVDTINEMLLDPELLELKDWVREWRQKQQRRGRSKKRTNSSASTASSRRRDDEDD